MGKYATKDQLKTIAQKIDADFPRKAGQYDDFTAGNAKQMVATVGNEDKSPCLNRTTGGSVSVGDRAKNISIDGCSIVVNQLFTQLSTYTQNGITFTFDSTTGILTLSGTATGSYANFGKKCDTLGINKNGNKYLTIIETLKNDNNIYIKFGYLNTRVSTTGINITNKGSIFKIGTCNSANGDGIGVSDLVDGTSYNGIQLRITVIDLTVMFGSAVADRLYALEQATAGSGISALRNLMELKYMAYTPNTLLSTKVIGKTNIGFNLWDEQWESGYFNLTTGEKVANNSISRSKNFIKVSPNTEYYFKSNNQNHTLLFYDADGNYISNSAYGTASNTFTTPSNAFNMYFAWASTTYNHDICINLSWSGAKNGQYEAYETHAYSYGSDILRGIPKLDANNNIYFDGDKKLPSGKILRRYGIVDLGTLDLHYESGNTRFWCDIPNIKPAQTTSAIANVLCTKYQNVNMKAQGISVWITGTFYIKDSNYTDEQSLKTALSGEYLIYELATPVEEDSTPYQEIEVINDWGMEEANVVGYNEGTATATEIPMPLGHDTLYTENLHDKLQNLPENANADGMYVVQQTGSQQSLTPLATWLGNNGYQKVEDISNKITANSQVAINIYHKKAVKTGKQIIIDLECVATGNIADGAVLATIDSGYYVSGVGQGFLGLLGFSPIFIEISGGGNLAYHGTGISANQYISIHICYTVAQ